MNLRSAGLSGAVRALCAVPGRFPAALVSSLVATGAAIAASEDVGDGAVRLAFCAVFAFPLFVAAALAGEIRSAWRFPAHGVALLAGVGAWLAFSGIPSRDAELQSMLVLIVGATALASATPALGGIAAWWRMNIGALNAAVMAAVFAGAVLIGLQLALVSLRQLFGLQMGDLPLHVFLACGMFVAPAGLLAFLPRDAEVYSAGWKLLAKFVLVPLGLVYVGIVAAYGLRIAFLRDLPDGMVALPVLVLGAFGTAAMLLAWPWQREEGWARWFAAIYPPAFLLASVLMFVALGIRIANEGVTFERYLGLAAGSVFVLIALAFLLRLSFAPAFASLVLALAALVGGAGPFSAAGVSLRSQTSRLQALLAQPWKGNPKLEKEIASRVRYLASGYGAPALTAFTGALPSANDKGWELGNAALDALGHPGATGVSFHKSWSGPVETTGFRRVYVREGGRVEVGKTKDGRTLALQILDETLVARADRDEVHTFDTSAIADAPEERAMPALDWSFEERTFRIVFLSATLQGRSLIDGSFVVLEK